MTISRTTTTPAVPNDESKKDSTTIDLDSIYPVHRIREALRHLEVGKHVGRVVITIAASDLE